MTRSGNEDEYGACTDMDTAQSASVKMMRYNPGKFGGVKGTCVGCLDDSSPEPLGWVVSSSPVPLDPCPPTLPCFPHTLCIFTYLHIMHADTPARHAYLHTCTLSMLTHLHIMHA